MINQSSNNNLCPHLLLLNRKQDSFTCHGYTARSWNCFSWSPLESSWVSFFYSKFFSLLFMTMTIPSVFFLSFPYSIAFTPVSRWDNIPGQKEGRREDF